MTRSALEKRPRPSPSILRELPIEPSTTLKTELSAACAIPCKIKNIFQNSHQNSHSRAKKKTVFDGGL